MQNIALPIGKLPPELLNQLLAAQIVDDPSVIVAPAVGMDCAVVNPDPGLLVIKSDPITFASDEIGWYVVQVNANDIVTTGATPRWFTATVLLPEGEATPALAEAILGQIGDACRALHITLVGGHTEVTHGLNRPIVAGTMFGQVASDRLVSPRNVGVGDWVLLTKTIPIETASILARELPERLTGALTAAEIARAAAYLRQPGISVVRDARVALAAGRVTAMHDPTEGGLAAALWELATACGRTIRFERQATPIDALAARICAVFGMDPLAAIASGALLLTVDRNDGPQIIQALAHASIPCTRIGEVVAGPPQVVLVDSTNTQDTVTQAEPQLLPWPERDEIGKAFAVTTLP